MQEFLAFLIDEWMLSVSFVALTLMLGWSFIAPSLRGFAELKPVEIIKTINAEGTVVLDVRSENEFLDGHIINSINIPANYLAKRMAELEKYKSSPVVVVCKSGSRSKMACVSLRKEGFENVVGLSGGLLAWQHDKFPLTKK
jgi:rhodanese-related sulfurtransferase